TVSGTIGFTFQGLTATATMESTIRDNNTDKVYWANNYTVTLSEGPNYDDAAIAGRYYDPDSGYVNVASTTPFRHFVGDLYPSDGVLVIDGNTGIAGGSTMARLTVHSSTNYEIDADTNGDGTYDWNSGILTWQ
ncbi:MAG: hypothetical protein JSU72_12835, partial [Deltaproteobacteria bacterium]